MRDDLFNELITSLSQAEEHARGRMSEKKGEIFIAVEVDGKQVYGGFDKFEAGQVIRIGFQVFPDGHRGQDVDLEYVELKGLEHTI